MYIILKARYAVITVVFLTFAIVMFVTEKIPLALTSMIVCIGLVITGVLSVGDAFNGFVNSNVIPVSYTHLDVYKRQA